jgi:hypothetical protein
MKEDILEQLVDDYLQAGGYFTRHNLKFRPRRDHPQFDRKQDSNHSDIDVVGLHPARRGVDRVWVVSCKSWQSGFDVAAKLDEIASNKIRSGRESWRFFRELAEPKWAEAFRAAVRDATGQDEFTYVTAVTRIRGDASAWENNPKFLENIGGNPIRMISLQDMMKELLKGMTTTVVPSQLGRTVQLLHAAGAKLEWPDV